MANNSGAQHGSGHAGSLHAGPHVVPKRLYIAVFLALIVLTWVTTFVSTVDLGRWNIFVALAIAVCKASLVVLFFMHVWYSTRLTKMIVVASMFWLFLLLFLTMADFWSRTLMGVPGR
jgi:cytochrome c oxidase subunit 4